MGGKDCFNSPSPLAIELGIHFYSMTVGITIRNKLNFLGHGI